MQCFMQVEWIVETNPDGRWYWRNSATDETAWQNPNAAAAAAAVAAAVGVASEEEPEEKEEEEEEEEEETGVADNNDNDDQRDPLVSYLDFA